MLLYFPRWNFELLYILRGKRKWKAQKPWRHLPRSPIAWPLPTQQPWFPLVFIFLGLLSGKQATKTSSDTAALHQERSCAVRWLLPVVLSPVPLTAPGGSKLVHLPQSEGQRLERAQAMGYRLTHPQQPSAASRAIGGSLSFSVKIQLFPRKQ